MTKARTALDVPNPSTTQPVGWERGSHGGKGIGDTATPAEQVYRQLQQQLMIDNIHPGHNQVAADATDGVGERRMSFIGGGLYHGTQGYSRTRSAEFGAPLAMICAVVIGSLLVAGCGLIGGSDNSGFDAFNPDSDEESEPAETTRRTIREEAPSTTDTTWRTPTTAAGPLPNPDWAQVEFNLQPVVQLDDPAMVLTSRIGSDNLWLAQRSGVVRRINRWIAVDDSSEIIQEEGEVMLDISDQITTDGEGGLLGLTFSATGRFMYVSYTNTSGNSVISEFLIDENNNVVADSERIIITIDQPFSNHNGGQIDFGPDGFLYIAMGDGGSGGDPENNGQDLQTLLGAILRIDPFEDSEGQPYTVPPDNPFADRFDAAGEIWLYGVRNPWKFSFDAVTGDMWIGDVGQDQTEEINFLANQSFDFAGKGANLGWRIMEGNDLFDGETPPRRHVGPVFTYGHDFGRCSVTGGYVYRGLRMDDLKGAYVFGDFCSGEVVALRRLSDGRVIVAPVELNDEIGQIVGFGQDSQQELYVLSADGKVLRIQHSRWERTRPLQFYGADQRLPAGSDRVLQRGPDDPVIADPSIGLPGPEEPEEDETRPDDESANDPNEVDPADTTTTTSTSGASSTEG